MIRCADLTTSVSHGSDHSQPNRGPFYCLIHTLTPYAQAEEVPRGVGGQLFQQLESDRFFHARNVEVHHALGVHVSFEIGSTILHAVPATTDLRQ